MRANRVSRVRSGAPSRPRRNAAARYVRPGASRRSLEVRHRRRKTARDAQLRTARDAGACEALPREGPPADAHAVLAPALEGFSPSLEMPGIAGAMLLSASWRRSASGVLAVPGRPIGGKESAQLRRPRPRSAMSGQRRFRPSICASSRSASSAIARCPAPMIRRRCGSTDVRRSAKRQNGRSCDPYEVQS